MPAQEGKWRKSPPELIETLHEAVGAALPDDAAVDFRPMFGYPCYWTGGNMFFATHQDYLILRLSDEDRAAFFGIPEARLFEPMPGRPMREYVVVPPKLVADRATLEEWVAKGYRYAASLPPKEKKASKRLASAKAKE
jgi:TfoX/Sxy family transcriptional regulator of competence genes